MCYFAGWQEEIDFAIFYFLLKSGISNKNLMIIEHSDEFLQHH